MLHVILESFFGTRVRFQSTSSAKFYFGWTEKLTKENIGIYTEKPITLRQNEECQFEIKGDKQMLLFRGALKTMFKNSLIFEIISEIRPVSTHESIRVRAKGLKVDIQCDRYQIEATSIDVSVGGIAILVDEPFEKGETLDIIVVTKFGPVKSACKVCYCREYKDEPGLFRIGLKFFNMPRMDQNRWNKQFRVAS